MLPTRSMIQTHRSLNHPSDSKIFSTYQSDLNSNSTHGNLVQHFGNTAYLSNRQRAPHQTITNSGLARPFVSASYQNLNSDSYIANRFSDNYSNNYRTSDDNVLRRSIGGRPVRTKLEHLFKVKVPAVSKVDQAMAYEQNFNGNGWVNDHFVSRKILKTDTNNLKDVLVSLGYKFCKIKS